MHRAAAALLTMCDYIFHQFKKMRRVNALRGAGDRTLEETSVTTRHREQGLDQVGMLQFRLHKLL